MKYFKESEFNCNGKPCFDKMNKNFIDKLDYARSFTKTSFQITSSWRSEEHNKSVGGSETSSHLKGLAVDISAKSSNEKYEIIKALLIAGLKRIGIAKTFIHVDYDYSKPQYLIWTY